jgi:hypothetical protein
MDTRQLASEHRRLLHSRSTMDGVLKGPHEDAERAFSAKGMVAYRNPSQSNGETLREKVEQLHTAGADLVAFNRVHRELSRRIP